MPWLSTFGARSAPLGRAIRNRRRSWTSPRSTDARTPIESAVARSLTRHATAVRAAVASHVAGRLSDDVISQVVDDWIPAALRDEHPLLTQQLIETLAEEILQSGAEALHESAMVMRPGHLRALEAAHRRVIGGAEMAGAPLPSQLNLPLPPVIPPPPPGWNLLGARGPNTPRVWLNLRLDLVNPYAVQYASTAAYNLAGQVTQNSLDSVRATVTRGYNEGWTVESMAELIQQKVGLFPRWSRAVDNYYQGFLSRGADEQWALGQAAKYAGRLRHKRAMMIARTETMRASNYGRMSSWDAMGGAGLFATHQAEVEWITGPKVAGAKVDPRVDGPCDVCWPMNGKRRPYHGEFSLPSGKVLPAPPAHPHCRCTILLHLPEPPEWDDLGGPLQWLQSPEV